MSAEKTMRNAFAEMLKYSNSREFILTKLGVQPGDRIGTFAWNNYQHLELYYAIPGAGAVCHTLNLRLFPDQLVYIVNHAEDKVVFCMTELTSNIWMTELLEQD